jgi:hypothetical protein
MELSMKPALNARRSLAPHLAALAVVLVARQTFAVTADFEDIGAALAPGSAVNDSLGFSSHGVGFNNEFTDFGGGFITWGGFAYSNVQNSAMPGFANQFAAYRPATPLETGTYAVGFVDAFVPFYPRITFASDSQVVSVKVANTTYAAISMRDGDAFAKRFGGPSGHDPDFFRLTIQGFDAANVSTGSVDFFLADYRFENDALDTIIGGFRTLDLSTLGTLRALEFTLSSSDSGPFGMNTPASFAIDDVVAVPEPGSALAAGVGLIALGAWCRRPTSPAAA